MPSTIAYVDRSQIRKGKLEEVKSAINELVEYLDNNGSPAIFYSVYIDQGGRHMSVVQVHPDSASLELHMEIGGPAFRKFTELIDLSAIDVYGEPSAKLLEQLTRKTQLLGRGTVTVHRLRAGFARFGVPQVASAGQTR
jgi:hypothetical protein